MKNTESVIGILVGQSSVKGKVARAQVLTALVKATDDEDSQKRAISSCVITMMEQDQDSVDKSRFTRAAILAFPELLRHTIDNFALHLVHSHDHTESSVQSCIEGFVIGLIEASVELNNFDLSDRDGWRRNLSHNLAYFLDFLCRQFSSDQLKPFSKEMAGRLSNIAPKYAYFVGVEELCRHFQKLFVGKPPSNETFVSQQPNLVWQIIRDLTSRYFLQLPFREQIKLMAQD